MRVSEREEERNKEASKSTHRSEDSRILFEVERRLFLEKQGALSAV
jgi:hypothetical protein